MVYQNCLIIWGSEVSGWFSYMPGEKKRLIGRLGWGGLGVLTRQTFCDIKYRTATQETHAPSKCL